MKPTHAQNLIAAALVCAFAATTAQAQTSPPKMKMTTDIPPEITTPDMVETRIGTLKFFDGFPDKETTQKVYDNLDFQRGVFPQHLPRCLACGHACWIAQRWCGQQSKRDRL